MAFRKYPQRPFPASKPLDCIAYKILTRCKSSINYPRPTPAMRSQSAPFFLKKRENCRKIIKVPLDVHETFGTIHTIQYHCVKYCNCWYPDQRVSPLIWGRYFNTWLYMAIHGNACNTWEYTLNTWLHMVICPYTFIQL